MLQETLQTRSGAHLCSLQTVASYGVSLYVNLRMIARTGQFAIFCNNIMPLLYYVMHKCKVLQEVMQTRESIANLPKVCNTLQLYYALKNRKYCKRTQSLQYFAIINV